VHFSALLDFSNSRPTDAFTVSRPVHLLLKQFRVPRGTFKVSITERN
jgi:hypothetical protein